MTMQYHFHDKEDGQYQHRHENWEEPHEHDQVLEGTIIGVGMAQESNAGRREVKSG